MILRRRLALLGEVSTAIEALGRAMLIALESDDPPNVTRDAEKTGPRTPLTADRAISNLRRMYGEARTALERERVKKVAKNLATRGLITDGDAESLKEDA